MKKIFIFIILFVMVFSSFVVVFGSGDVSQNVYNEPQTPIVKPFTGAGSSQTISAELNYTQAGVSTTFDKIQATVNHTEFDIGQSLTVHFSNSYVCKNPVSGMPPNDTGKMVIEEQSPTTEFLKSHYANVTYSSTKEAVTYANFTDEFTASVVFIIFVEAYVDYSEAGKDYKNVSAPITISVNAAPSVTISDNQAVQGYADTNTTVLYTADATGGWIPYAYQWTNNLENIARQTNSTLTEHYTIPGTYKINVCTVDATGYNIISNQIDDHVAYPPKVNLTASQKATDSGQKVEFFSNLIHGNGKVALTWSINGTVVSGQTGRDFNETFSGTGNYNVKVTAEDQADYVVTSNLTEKVYPPISSKLIISQSEIDVGQEIHFRLNVTGSSGDYTSSYNLIFTDSDTTLLTGSGLQFNFTFPTESPFNCYGVALNWKAVSSTGAVTYGNDSAICVHVDPAISITEEYTSRDINIDNKFTSSGPFTSGDFIGIYGGWKPYVVSWMAENLTTGKWITMGTTSGDSASSLLYSFSAAGSYEILAHLRDASGYQVNSSEVELTVNTALRLNASIVPSRVVDMHNSEACTSICVEAERTGGSNIDSCCIRVNGDLVTQYVEEANPIIKVQQPMPLNPGKYEYVVSALDDTGGSATGYANFTVLANDMSVTTNVPSLTVQGNAYSLDASATAPSYFSFKHDFNLVGYTYSWNIGKTSKTGNSIVYDFAKSGIYTVNLTVKADYVTDYNGQELSAYQEKNVTQTVRVVNSSSSTNIHIKQFKYEASSNYYFAYWVSFTDSSYSTSFYSINHTAYTPQNIQTYANGSVFVNVSVQDSNYAPGTQDICFTVINNESQTNSVNGSFIISLSQSNQISIYTIANFFGGFYNFLIFIATVGALVIGYASFRESKRPPVIDITQPNGKTNAYQLQGKKIKKGGR